MIQLLIKDIRIQKRYIGLGFLFVGIFFFALGAFEGMPLSVPAAIFSHFLIVVASKMDEKNNNGRMLVSFPLRRRDIVTSKYIGIIVFMGLAFLLTALWRLISGLVLPTGELPWFDVQSVTLTIVLLLMFYSIYFPMFFAFGTRIVQVLDVIVIFVVGGVIVLGLRIAEWSGIHVGQRFATFRTTADQTDLALWGVCGCLVLLISSWVLSVALYNRKSI